MSLPTMMAFDFQRYLFAKRTVDDRALNKDVWKVLSATPLASAQVLEIGCGVGTMRTRLDEWGLAANGMDYLGVDSDAVSIGTAAKAGFGPGNRFECRDVYHLEGEGGYDLLIASAFLDLVDLETALPRLLRQLRPGGLAYLPLNFDGVTIFVPEHDRDDAVLTSYHASMDTRPSGGHSLTGRRLFHALPGSGFEILASGSSDWLVAPDRDGEYPADEAYFLEHILYFFERSCAGVGGLEEWLAERRRQIREGELVYIAHQLDFLARRPA